MNVTIRVREHEMPLADFREAWLLRCLFSETRDGRRPQVVVWMRSPHIDLGLCTPGWDSSYGRGGLSDRERPLHDLWRHCGLAELDWKVENLMRFFRLLPETLNRCAA